MNFSGLLLSFGLALCHRHVNVNVYRLCIRTDIKTHGKKVNSGALMGRFRSPSTDQTRLRAPAHPRGSATPEAPKPPLTPLRLRGSEHSLKTITVTGTTAGTCARCSALREHGGRGCKSRQADTVVDLALSPSQHHALTGRAAAGGAARAPAVPAGSPLSAEPGTGRGGRCSPGPGRSSTLPGWRRPCWGGQPARRRHSVMAAPRPRRAGPFCRPASVTF